jgi:hypothetical protein
VIAFSDRPVRRIAFFIALSALLHALLLWLPEIHLPHAKINLPPLTVRLQALPETPQAIVPAGWSVPGQPSADTPSSAVPALRSLQPLQAAAVPQPFPKHLQLTFAVSRHGSALDADRMTHHLEIAQDHYTLTSLWDKLALLQSSQGSFDEHGLRPELFLENNLTAGSPLSREARFDWSNHKLFLFDNSTAPLDKDAQDTLSFMYQLAQLPLDGEYFPMAISDGEQLTVNQIEIGVLEEIDTPMGEIKGRHLRQIHGRNEAYFEIWIAPEYRMLPVKFRRVNANEQPIEEFVIRDIRAAD